DTTGPSLGTCSITPANGTSTSNTTVTATFSGATDLHGPVVYKCSKDGAAYATCTSQYSATVSGLGSHSLAIRAVDAFNNSTEQCSSTWPLTSSDVPPPVLPWVDVPMTPTSDTPPFPLHVSSNEPLSKLTCQLDSAAADNCLAAMGIVYQKPM